MVDIGIVDAYMCELGIKLHQLLLELAVRTCSPKASVIVAAGISDRVGKQQITIRQDCKVSHKVINPDVSPETAVKSIYKYTVVMTVHYVKLTFCGEYVKTLNYTVVSGTLALSVKAAQELASAVKEEECIC